MRATFLAKLTVLILAAIALIYGISIVIGKSAVAPQIIERSETVGSATPAVVLAIPETTPSAASIPATEIPPTVGAPSSAQEKKLEAYQVDVKNSVQLLEEGNAAQARIEMNLAIERAIGDGVSAAQVDVLRNMLMRIEYCQAGPEGMLAWLSTTEAALADAQTCCAVSIDRSRMKIEALLAMGKLQESWDESKIMLACFAKPGPAQMKEALALEQAIRIAGTAGANDQIPDLEARLRATVEAGITLKTLQDPQLPLATLGTLAKMRGDCASAIKLYNQALEGFDINKWLREKRVAPWRLQVLALVAMDRIDCLRQTGQIERAKGSASVLAADLATALGEQDPLAEQAADQRDQMLYAPMAP